MRLRLPRPAVLLAAVCIPLAAAGCGGGPRLAPVSGTVTYNGKPLAGATIVFHPDQELARGAMGHTDDQGRYTLWTNTPGDGALVGTHQVTITLRGPGEKAAVNPALRKEGLGEAYYDQVASSGKPLIPEKFFSTATSKLTATVEDKRSNEIDFPLTGDVGGK